MLAYLGKFHLLAIHFPVALLMAAALGEVWALYRGYVWPWMPVRFCLQLGTAGAIVAAALGWCYAAGIEVEAPDLLWWHRWLGTATAALCLPVVWLDFDDMRRENHLPNPFLAARSWRTRIGIWALAGFVAATAHFGGLLAHGANFFQ